MINKLIGFFVLLCVCSALKPVVSEAWLSEAWIDGGVSVANKCAVYVLMSGAAVSGIDEGVAASKKTDFATVKSLATKGDTLAEYNLGVMYHKGQGVPLNYDEAIKWYRLAASQGNANARNNLGVMYENGQSVPNDYHEALKWYQLAADQGDANAQYNIGLMYYKGQGTPADYKIAVKWYRLSADQGNGKAQNNLGMLYYNGYGVSSKVAAYALFSVSIKSNSTTMNPAASNRAEVKTCLSPNEIQAGQDLAREMLKPGNLLKALDSYIKEENK